MFSLAPHPADKDASGTTVVLGDVPLTSIGTGVAAGVAQTALQAQQLARQHDQPQTQATQNARRLRDLLERHLHALEESEDPESPDQIHIDGHLPQHRSPNQQKEDEQRRPATPASPTEPTSPPQSVAPTALPEQTAPPLYRHVDVQA
jgi:hypothetical protein